MSQASQAVEGARFSRMTIIGPISSKMVGSSKKRVCLARCDCGTERVVQVNNIVGLTVEEYDHE